MDAEQIGQPGKHLEQVQAKSIVCYLPVSELAAAAVALSKGIGMRPSAVS